MQVYAIYIFLFLECNKFEFSDIHQNHDDIAKASNIVILRIRNITKDQVTHSLPLVDRCCKSDGWDQDVNQLNREFIIKDSISRIPCNISKSSFLKDYVMKRNCVILSNCSDAWKARKWTFKGVDQWQWLNDSKNGKDYTICMIWIQMYI